MDTIPLRVSEKASLQDLRFTRRWGQNSWSYGVLRRVVWWLDNIVSENGDSEFLWNFGVQFPYYTVQQPSELRFLKEKLFPNFNFILDKDYHTQHIKN
jgi:hypothetical protein